TSRNREPTKANGKLKKKKAAREEDARPDLEYGSRRRSAVSASSYGRRSELDGLYLDVGSFLLSDHYRIAVMQIMPCSEFHAGLGQSAKHDSPLSPEMVNYGH